MVIDVPADNNARLKSAFDTDSSSGPKLGFDQMKDQDKRGDKTAMMKDEYTWEQSPNLESSSVFGASIFTSPLSAVPKFPSLEPLSRKLSSIGQDQK